jgi:hypothetical protein
MYLLQLYPLYQSHGLPTTACNTIIILWKILNCASQLKLSQQWIWRVPSSVKPCSLMGVQRSFGATYYLQVKCSRVSQASKQASSKHYHLLDLLFDTPIYQWTTTRLHGVKSHKTSLYVNLLACFQVHFCLQCHISFMYTITMALSLLVKCNKIIAINLCRCHEVPTEQGPLICFVTGLI